MDHLEHLISQSAETAGLSCPPHLLQRLSRYAELLKASPHRSFATWNGDEEGVRMHFRDSFLTIPKTVPEQFLDLGSGAGIPGIIYAILWPDTRAVLLESQKKRCEFLKESLSQLGIHNRVSVLCGRAEEKAHDPELREQFDLVTARALAPFAQFLEYAVGFARVGGVLHAIRGLKDSNALVEHAALLKAFHLESAGQTVYQLNPDEPASRWVFLLKKTAPCLPNIPRNSRQIGRKL